MDVDAAEKLDKAAEVFDGQKGDIVAAALELFFKAPLSEQQAALVMVTAARAMRFPGIPGHRTHATNAGARKAAKPMKDGE